MTHQDNGGADAAALLEKHHEALQVARYFLGVLTGKDDELAQALLKGMDETLGEYTALLAARSAT